MKYWKHLTFLPKLRAEIKENWLIDHEIDEKSLNTDAKYLTECKFLRPIWHSEEEIINWVKNEQLAGRIEIDNISTEELNAKPKRKKIEEFVRITAKLIKKEEIKDKKGNDLLVLTFEGLDRKLTAFIRRLVDRKDELKVGDSYRITYGSNRNETKFDKDILLNFINLTEEKQNREIFKVKKLTLIKREELKNNHGNAYLQLTFRNFNQNTSNISNVSEDFSENIENEFIVIQYKFKFDVLNCFTEGQEYNLVYYIDKNLSFLEERNIERNVLISSQKIKKKREVEDSTIESEEK